MRVYRLTDQNTGEPVGEFETEDAAIFEVAAIMRARGREAVNALALTYVDPEGVSHVIGDGAKLAERAYEVTA